MKKVLAFCLVAIALVLTGCKDKNKAAFNGFSINQGASLTMVQGETVRLSMTVDGQGVSPEYTFVSSDPLKVDVDSTGVVYAMNLTESPVYISVTGKAIIDNNPVEFTQVINITVIDFADALVFHDFYLMQPGEDWEKGKYAIYIKRRNRASEVPDGDDALVRTTKIEGDTNDLRAYFPEYNEWVHLYDTTVEGTLIQVGLFKDSVQPYRAWILSSDCFFDGDGAFQCASQGAILETYFAFIQDSKYAYVLGEREFIDDMCALDTIRPDSVEAMPFPGYFQTGHFFEEEYLDFWTAVFDGQEVSIDDYTFWAKYDCKIKPVSVSYDEETGSSSAGVYPVMGYPTSGVIDIESGTGDAWLMTENYAFDATVFSNPLVGYCLKLEEKVDEETGETYLGYAQPFQMSESYTVHYAASSTGVAQKRVNHTPEHEKIGAIRNSTLKAQMRVVNTLGAIFRMAAMK